MQHFEERLADAVAVEIMSIQTKNREQEHNKVTKKVSSSQLQK